MMGPQTAVGPAAIFEMDQERDRKTCVSLDLKVTGANRELAQWLLDHPRYANTEVARWLSCDESRIRRLRKWAADGFVGLPQQNAKVAAQNAKSAMSPNSALNTNDNSEPDDDLTDDDAVDEVAAPAEVEESVLYVINRINENARASNKILRASALDREAADRISTAIERMIQKWRSIQSTLARKG